MGIGLDVRPWEAQDIKDCEILFESSSIKESFTNVIESPINIRLVCRDADGLLRGFILCRMVPWVDALVADESHGMKEKVRVMHLLGSSLESLLANMAGESNRMQGIQSERFTMLMATDPKWKTWIKGLVKRAGWTGLLWRQDGSQVNEILIKQVPISSAISAAEKAA